MKPRPLVNPTRLTPPATDGPWADQLQSTIVHAKLYNCAPDWNIPEYRLSYYGILMAVSGMGWVTLNSTTYPLRPDAIVFLRLGDTLSAGHDPANPISCYSTGFLLHTQAGEDLIKRRNWPDMLLATPDLARQWANLMAPIALDPQAQTTRRQTLAHARLILALDWIDSLLADTSANRLIARPGPAPRSDPRIEAITRYIDTHLASPFTSKELAKAAHVTPAHLAFLFQQQSLPTPMDYVRARRIDLARTLLSTTDDKIAAIAHTVGYSDPFHFSRVFKNIQGCSPEAYRASCKYPFGS